MSILCGFDFLYEISHAALLRQLKRTILIGGQPIQPPFAVEVPSSAGSANIIIEDMLLDINGDNTLTVDFVFARSSLIPKSPLAAAIYPLSGTIRVNVIVQLSPVAPNQQSIIAQFTTAVVTLILSAEGQQVIVPAAKTAGVTPEVFGKLLEASIRAYVQGLPTAALSDPYHVVPGLDGTLEPLQFTRLRLHCLGRPDRTRQGVALFGNLFAATQNEGQPLGRIDSAIAPGQDIMTAFSLRVLQQFLLCPALATSLAPQLGRTPSITELPTNCGHVESIEINSVTVNRIESSLQQGFLQVDLHFSKSGPCYDASGSLVTRVRFGTNGVSIIPNIASDPPQVFVEVPWYCAYAMVITGWWFGVWMHDTLRDGITAFAQLAAQNAVNAIVLRNFAGLPGVFLTSVAVTPSEFAIHGRMPLGEPARGRPELDLQGVIQPRGKPTSQEGVATMRVFCKAEPQPYEFVEISQPLRAFYDLRARLLPLPLSVTYSVRGRSGEWKKLSPALVLAGSWPTVVVDDVECSYPQPVATGGSSVIRGVPLRYRATGTAVTLLSEPTDGNFWIDLRAEVLDASGQPPAGVDPAPVRTLFFRGSEVIMGEAYRNDFEECMRRIKSINDRYIRAKDVPAWEQAFEPAERLLYGELRRLSSLGTVEAEDMARHFRNVHNGALSRIVVTGDRVKASETPASTETETLESRLEAASHALSTILVRLRMRLQPEDL